MINIDNYTYDLERSKRVRKKLVEDMTTDELLAVILTTDGLGIKIKKEALLALTNPPKVI